MSAQDDDAPKNDDKLRATLYHHIDEVRRDLHAAADKACLDLRRLVDTLILRTMAPATNEETRKNQSIGRLAQGETTPAYRKVMAASKVKANSELAAILGVSQTMMSKYASGKSPIPRKRALAAQQATVSDEFPNGIEPTKTFWKGGVVG